MPHARVELVTQGTGPSSTLPMYDRSVRKRARLNVIVQEYSTGLGHHHGAASGLGVSETAVFRGEINSLDSLRLFSSPFSPLPPLQATLAITQTSVRIIQ